MLDDSKLRSDRVSTGDLKREDFDGVRAPIQERGRDSWERVLRAGAELLSERGFEGFTLGEVSRRAGVSNGSIYWRVQSKEALFAAINEREIDALITEFEEGAKRVLDQSADLNEAVRGAVEMLARPFEARIDLMRVFIVRAGVDAATFERGGRAASVVHQLFISVLMKHETEIRQPAPEHAADLMFRIVNSNLLQWIATLSRVSRSEVPFAEMVDELCDVATTYLLSKSR